MLLPRIGLTVGDPSGIGPEICAKAISDPRVESVCRPIIYGPSSVDLHRFTPGIPSADSGKASYEALTSATVDALAGRIEAITTAPISKVAWAEAGLKWQGHTELLAHLTDSQNVAMMFHSAALRVVLATVHVPIAKVPKLLTQEQVERTILLTAEELPRFGFSKPKLAVAGLNPHAGEEGLMGEEDDLVLRPAVNVCRNKGVNVDGPFPSDTVFVRALSGEYDAVVACYHDQGLIPVKLVAFGKAVNVTLGLPIIRTSVDHGTAYDIAGKGTADPSSLIEAILLASSLVAQRAQIRDE